MSSIGTGGWGWGWLGQDGAGLSSSYSGKVLSYSPIAYWPLNEATGTNANCLVNSAQDGTYTGVTLGQTGIGDGNTCPLFDGTNDYVDIYSAALNTAFSGTAGTMVIWAKVFNAAVWADTNSRMAVSLSDIGNENRVKLRKSTTNNRLDAIYNQGGAGDVTVSRDPGPSTSWLHMAMTWNVAATALTFYVTGLASATDTIAAGWVQLFDSDKCAIGSHDTTPSQCWYGWLAHCAIWDSVLTPAQIADIATV